tara:strand:+ start:260 stop:823 length:564 start_codon:yes stop_codon:yes gene_type:complete
MARETRSERAIRQIADLNASGISDAEIARRIGVNRSTIGRWRKGEVSPKKRGKGGRLTRLWNRSDKVIGAGGTVNLTSFFRRVWVKDGEPILPLAIKPLPTYSWPQNAPVSIIANFSSWIHEVDGGQVEYAPKTLSSTFRDSDSLTLGDTGEGQMTDALLEYMQRTANYPLIFARMEFVLLRRGENE